ncbi:16S rRNA (cytidine(1402)-2'-O)-methyltransferase [bacterium]|nr:16S rRNA (cytidine(1402)-2'-O)-methyltransferase [bacterium]
MRGELFLIGTPIGNLNDMSPRAKETLAALDVLYCEDTRVTGKLLSLIGLSLPLVSLSDDHSPARTAQAIEAVNAGHRVGFATDAGMPGVSDPGRRLVRAAWQAGIHPVVIPGPSSPSTLLAACPFVDNRFRFVGFPPRKPNDRARFVALVAESPEPCFFFESPHRVHAVLDLICAAVEPARELLAGREMTKLYEQVELFSAGEWDKWRTELPQVGEFTVAVAGRPVAEAVEHDEDSLAAALERLLEAGFTKRDAVKALAAVWEVSANELKKLLYSDQE